jgi:hypothetical protein
MQLVANETDNESDAAMPLMPNGTHRGEGAVENGAQDKGDDMTDSELEAIVDTMLDNVQLNTPAELWTSEDSKVTVDLPLVARLVGCQSNPDRVAANTVLTYIEMKQLEQGWCNGHHGEDPATIPHIRAATAQNGEAAGTQMANLRDPEGMDERNAAPETEAAAVSRTLAPRSSRCSGVSHDTIHNARMGYAPPIL